MASEGQALDEQRLTHIRAGAIRVVTGDRPGAMSWTEVAAVLSVMDSAVAKGRMSKEDAIDVLSEMRTSSSLDVDPEQAEFFPRLSSSLRRVNWEAEDEEDEGEEGEDYYIDVLQSPHAEAHALDSMLVVGSEDPVAWLRDLNVIYGPLDEAFATTFLLPRLISSCYIKSRVGASAFAALGFGDGRPYLVPVYATAALAHRHRLAWTFVRGMPPAIEYERDMPILPISSTGLAGLLAAARCANSMPDHELRIGLITERPECVESTSGDVIWEIRANLLSAADRAIGVRH